MPRMKYWNGTSWIPLDAKDADTVDGKHASDFAPIAHVGEGGAAHALATTLEAGFLSGPDKEKLDGVQTGAEVNQNAFTAVKIGSTNVVADTKSDTLELAAGTGIILTPDATNDKITIAVDSAGGTGAIATLNANGRVEDSEKLGGKTIFDLDARYEPFGGGGGGGGTGEATLKYNVDSINVASDTNKVTVPIATYTTSTDVLLVFQNSVFMQSGRDYTYAPGDNTITKTSDLWVAGTALDFVVITVLGSSAIAVVAQYESLVTVGVDNTTQIAINIPQYNVTTDALNVYQDGVRLAKTAHYTVSADGLKIDLVGSTVNTGVEFQFVVLKKTIV